MIKRHRWSITLAVSLVACFLVLQEVAVRRAQALSNDTYQELDTFASVLAIVQKNQKADRRRNQRDAGVARPA
jgi:hypothetical protein